VAALCVLGAIFRNLRSNKDVVILLQAAVEKEGSISAFAKRHSLWGINLSNMLNGKRPVSASLVKALGLQMVYAPELR
jgi:hypothetical protein